MTVGHDAHHDKFRILQDAIHGFELWRIGLASPLLIRK
jgi:hypothetical protein